MQQLWKASKNSFHIGIITTTPCHTICLSSINLFIIILLSHSNINSPFGNIIYFRIICKLVIKSQFRNFSQITVYFTQRKTLNLQTLVCPHKNSKEIVVELPTQTTHLKCLPVEPDMRITMRYLCYLFNIKVCKNYILIAKQTF